MRCPIYWVSLVASSTLLIVGACSSGRGVERPFDDADLTERRTIRYFSRASAPSVFGHNWWPVVEREEAEAGGEVPDCPVRSEDPASVSWTGGCTDASGTAWEGQMTSWTGGGLLYEGYGFLRDNPDCGTEDHWVFDGIVSVYGPDDAVEFSVQTTMEGEASTEDCSRIEGVAGFDYTGIQLRQGAVQTWSGSGWMGTDGFGMVDAITEDEVIDTSVCQTEASSGTTTLSAGGHVAVLRYDGSTKCDDTPSVPFTLDGEERGELEGVSCSTHDGSPARTAPMALLALLFGRR